MKIEHYWPMFFPCCQNWSSHSIMALHLIFSWSWIPSHSTYIEDTWQFGDQHAQHIRIIKILQQLMRKLKNLLNAAASSGLIMSHSLVSLWEVAKMLYGSPYLSWSSVYLLITYTREKMNPVCNQFCHFSTCVF